MKKLALALVLGLAAACDPSIPSTPPPTNQIQANFNPAASPPVLPLPTDLAVNRYPDGGGRLNIPVNTSPNPSDQNFIVYLDSLSGYPSDTPASATFSGALDSKTLTPGTTVLIIDEADGNVANFTQLSGFTVAYTDTSTPIAASGAITIPQPAGGWTPGHTYDFALTDGIKGAKGEVLVGTPPFALVRSSGSLVASCPPPYTSPQCASSTSLVASTSNAIALEQIRLEYQPALSYLDKTPATARAHIPLLWRFTASGDTTMDFNSTGPSCPPNVPSPNNLALNLATGLVKAPICANQPKAQQEFTTDYLNTLNGFPTISPATAPVIHGDLDPTTVNSSSVIVLDLTPVAAADGGVAPPAVVTPSLLLYTGGTLTVLPPAPGWTKGHTYALGVLTGAPGLVQDTNGNPVVPNDAFALIENASPVALCPDGGSPDPLQTFTCPSTLTVAALSDAQASQAELVREALAPVLAAIKTVSGVASITPTVVNPDAGQPVYVGGIAMAWAFTITSQAEIKFNLAPSPTDGGASAAIVPFPNDLLFLGSQGDGGHVCLAATLNGACLDQGAPQTVQAIDTLDGFSLTAPAVVVNDGTLNALDALTDGVHVLQLGQGADGGAPFTVAATANLVQVSNGADGGGPLIPAPSATPMYATTPPAGLLPLAPAVPLPLVQVCVNCDNTPDPVSGNYASDALEILPTVPLIESTPYAGYVQTDLLGDNGLPVAPSLIFALIRMANPLFDGTNATVSGLTNAQAQQLEGIRLAYKPMFDALDANGLPRSTLAMAWNFHTQSIVSHLFDLYSLANPAGGVAGVLPATIQEVVMPLDAGIEAPMASQTAFPSTPEYMLPIDSAFTLTAPDGGTIPFGKDPAPHSHVAHFVAGSYYSENTLTGPGGTINPDPSKWQTSRVPFILSIPNPATTVAGVTPPNGWPVVIFGHGVTRSRIDMIAIADAFAAVGYAVEAEDVPFHGDRSSCVGVAAAKIPVFPDGGIAIRDDDACHDLVKEKCDEATVYPDAGANPTYGKCIAKLAGTSLPCYFPHKFSTPNQSIPAGVPGDLFCTLQRAGICNELDANPANWTCIGGDYLREADDNIAQQPVISGWDIFSTANLFQTRDNLRQQMVDLGAAENILLNASTGMTPELAEWGVDPIDGTNINYTGQSLGGILGTIFTAVSTNVQNSVLNVPGGGFVQILETSPAFGPTYQAFEATYAAQGINAGSAAFDTLIHSAEWILDGADPRPAGEYVTAGYAPTALGAPALPTRNVLVLYINGDQVVPNGTTASLLAAEQSSPFGEPSPSVVEFQPSSIVTDPSGHTLGLDPGDRHGFMLNFVNPVLTTEAQGDASTFILTGTLPTGQ